ncbi:MAG: TldD/PmbA family protein, partial [Clostridia bacterium]|nr:TldD/PmbA family protein [Clostridia bacterium]
MLDRLVELLKSRGVYGWEISDEKMNGWEFYFIRHELDQHRAKNVEHITVKVYQMTDDGESVGFASEEIAPTAAEQEIEKLVSDLAYRATLVKNRPFTLTPPSE